MTPAAGPLNRVWTGTSPAERAVMIPPFDRMVKIGPAGAEPRSPDSSRPKYSRIRPPMWALITATMARSYSRRWGQSSWEVET